MIKEAYCSFEVSKLLREKGFDGECSYRYIAEPDYRTPEFVHSPIGKGSRYLYNAPTHQIAMKWLREVHQLHISVDVSPIYGKVKDEKGRNTCGLLYWHYMASGVWMNENYNPQRRAFVVSGKSNEEVVEEALKFVLENLENLM